MIDYFRIGKITKVHGVKGEVKIHPTTDEKKRFDDLKEVFLTKDEDFSEGTFDYTLTITSVKYAGDSPILKLKGYDTIEDSMKLIGYSIYIDRNHAIKLKENEYFLSDLIGSKCYLADEMIGNVKDVMTTKANGILVVTYKQKDIFIPFVYDFVGDIDIAKKMICIKSLEGLL